MSPNEPEPITTVNLTDHIILPKSAYPNIKSVVILFFVFVLYSIGLGILFGIALIVLDGLHVKSQLIESLLNLLVYIMSQLLLIRYAIKKSKKQFQPVRIHFKKIKIGLIPVFIISTVALIVLLDKTASWIPMPVWIQKFFEKAFTKDVFSVATVTLAAPILEEILARGIVLKGLLKNYTPNKAILISAIFFSVLHLNPWQAIPAFFGGLYLGWVYYKTQSVISGIIIHTTINVTATFLLFLPKHAEGFYDLLGPTYYIIACLLSAIILWVGCKIISQSISMPAIVAD